MKMIFVTVGTHSQQFNRLLEKLDELKQKKIIIEKIFAQIGNSTYAPKNFKSKKFLTDKEFEEYVKKSFLVVSHAGAGAIITSLKHKKKLVLVPRKKEFGEHTDSHQLDLARFLESKKKALAVFDISDLEKKILQAKTFKFSTSTKAQGIVKALNEYFKVKS